MEGFGWLSAARCMESTSGREEVGRGRRGLREREELVVSRMREDRSVGRISDNFIASEKRETEDNRVYKRVRHNEGADGTSVKEPVA